MEEPPFTPRDLRQMAAIGLAPEEAARQLELFRHPPPFTRLVRPCRPGDGILTLAESGEAELLAAFDRAAHAGRIGKLVPASGAATRMFKDALSFRAGPEAPPSEAMAAAVAVTAFFANLESFAFHEDLAAVLSAEGIELEAAVRSADHGTVLRYLLDPVGLGYAELPKGLLRFHRYPEGPRTPLEEHLVEAAALCRGGDGSARVHLTVSPDHLEAFERLVDRVRPGLETRHDCRLEVSFSTQRRATDTLAVDPLDQPFRQADGSLLFRPGGHGALLRNLLDLGHQGWDVVVLKNIDNVVRDDSTPLVYLWKKLLCGLLVSIEERIFAVLNRLEAVDTLEAAARDAVLRRGSELCGTIGRALPSGFATAELAEQKGFLEEALDRPLRVCGMVRNQGEPGGGPFWVQSTQDGFGGVAPQIVEASQVDPGDPEQQSILRQSTHFNPVDLVCGLRDHHGAPYDLDRYVDPATVFISAKTFEGRPLKALERPGLWNGAMAGWNTLFVEVPDATFAPVKTVLDLLRPEHQERNG